MTKHWLKISVNSFIVKMYRLYCFIYDVYIKLSLIYSVLSSLTKFLFRFPYQVV